MTFFISPTFEPDRSCLEKIPSLDFAGTTQESKQSALRLFGTDNVWDTADILITDSTTTTSENKKNSALQNKKNTILSFLCLFLVLIKIF